MSHPAISMACKVLSGFVLAMVIGAGTAEAGKGAEIWQRCVTCHQPDGVGIPGVFPPLKNRLGKIVSSAQGREYVTMVLTSGLFGTIVIDGQSYMGAMPAQNLSDAEVADVVNFIAGKFGKPAPGPKKAVLSEKEVAAIRSRHKDINTKSTLDLRSKVPFLNEQ